MKIEIELDDIDYGSVAAALMPVVGEKLKDAQNPMIRMLAARAGDSDFIIRTVNALPQDFKDKLIVSLLNKNKERMRASVTKFALSKGMRFRIRSVRASL